ADAAVEPIRDAAANHVSGHGFILCGDARGSEGTQIVRFRRILSTLRTLETRGVVAGRGIALWRDRLETSRYVTVNPRLRPASPRPRAARAPAMRRISAAAASVGSVSTTGRPVSPPSRKEMLSGTLPSRGTPSLSANAEPPPEPKS